MFCPLCNPEYTNAGGKLDRKNPNLHMTTGIIGTDGKRYLKCQFCGFQELDPDAEQPPDGVDEHKQFELAERHDLLTVAHEKLKQDNYALEGHVKTLQSENEKLKSARFVRADPNPNPPVAPGGWIPPTHTGPPAVSLMPGKPLPEPPTHAPVDPRAGNWQSSVSVPLPEPLTASSRDWHSGSNVMTQGPLAGGLPLTGKSPGWEPRPVAPVPPAPVQPPVTPAVPTPEVLPPAHSSVPSNYPKLLHDPTTVPQKPDRQVHNVAEEEKARSEGYTVVLP